MKNNTHAYYFYLHLNQCSSNDKIKKLLYYHCSLILTGVKPSILISIPSMSNVLDIEESKIIKDFVEKLNLSIYEFPTTKSHHRIFIYDDDLLNRSLNKCKFYLEQLYYPMDQEIPFILKQLNKKFYNRTFPHEIGFFLGYTPDDVNSFIIHKGKNYLFNGRWKVYHNPQNAKTIFHQYDKIQKETAQHIMSTVSYNSYNHFIQSLSNK